MLRELVPGQLWVADEPFARMGFEIGARMTLVRLASGLLVHSPITLTDTLKREIDALGPVACIVAPSGMHYLDVPPFARAYPDARVYAAEEAQRPLKDVTIAGVLGDQPAPEWAGELKQVVMRGSRLYREVDFFHPASRTLIVTDLMFNIPEHSSGTTRIWAKLLGILGRPSMSRSFHLTVRDRAAVQASLERIQAWDFDRIILSHGQIVETGGKAAFERAFARFLA